MRKTVIAAALLALPPATAAAQDTTCFARSYTQAHLASHPVQRVAQMAIGPGDAPGVTLLRARLRDGTRLAAYATCQSDGAVALCLMEGDAGAFLLRARAKGNILLIPGEQGMTFESATDFISFFPDQGDDREFLLYPVGLSGCP